MEGTKRAYLELHIAVFLFGFTAILGDLILLSALVIVWWRVLLTGISLLFLVRFGKALKLLSRGRILQYMGIGCLVVLHWLCFYGAIKYANASIALIAMATASFFTALLEPLMLKQQFKWYELALGLLVIPGMVLIVDATEIGMLPGVWVGLLAALLASVFSILNKKLIKHSDPLNITFLEIGSSWIFLTLFLPFYFMQVPVSEFFPSVLDWIYLAILSFLCTTVAYVLALKSLHHISAFASTLVVNLEPVYGILLAVVLLKEYEEMNFQFYVGGFIILIAVFIYPLIRKRYEKFPLP